MNHNVTFSSLQRCSNSNTTWHPSFVFTFFHFFAFFRSFDLNLDSFSLSFTSTNACKKQYNNSTASWWHRSISIQTLFAPFHFFLSHLFSSSVSTWQICRWPSMKTEHRPEHPLQYSSYLLLGLFIFCCHLEYTIMHRSGNT